MGVMLSESNSGGGITNANVGRSAPAPGHPAIAAYQAIYQRLPSSRRRVLDDLRRFGRRTANQLASLRPKNGLDNASIRSRLGELVQQRLAVRLGKVIDPISGQRALLYRAARPGETLPCELPKRVTRAELEAEIEKLGQWCQEWQMLHDRFEEDLQLLFQKFPGARLCWERLQARRSTTTSTA
jgi:hypothetical protein